MRRRRLGQVPHPFLHERNESLAKRQIAPLCVAGNREENDSPIPLKVFEAAAHGVPVVASRLLASQLGWNGALCVPPDPDPESFARACVALHDDAAAWQRQRDAAIAELATAGSARVGRAAVATAVAAARQASLRSRNGSGIEGAHPRS